MGNRKPESQNECLRLYKIDIGIEVQGLAQKFAERDIFLELSDRARELKIVPYLEWVLNSPGVDRNHTQYNRLYPEMSYDCKRNAVLALHRYTKQYGFLAADTPPEGFLTGRIDFIGRAGTIWDPRVLQTLKFLPCRNTEPCPTFDPIGSLLLGVNLEPKGVAHAGLLIGCADSHETAADWIERHLKPKTD